MDEVRRCETCMYARRPSSRLLRIALHDFPGLLICFRCAEADGEMNGVSPGGTCRDYRKRRKPPKRSKPAAKPTARRSRPAAAQKERPDECRIPLSNGMFARVDPQDFEELSRYKWYATGKSPHISAARREKGRTIYMHRQIMKARRGQFVDHKDGDELNDHRDNLRFCTWHQNQANKRSRRGSSCYVGVSPFRDKWKAEIACRRKHYYLGLFEDEVEAAKARDRKAWELHGEFAYLNFPEDYGL
jgi:hypothetical protein